MCLQYPAELCESDELASRLVAAISVESFTENGDGLDEMLGDSAARRRRRIAGFAAFSHVRTEAL